MIIACAASAQYLNRPINDGLCHPRRNQLDHGDLTSGRLEPNDIRYVRSFEGNDRVEAPYIRKRSRMRQAL